MMMKMWKRTAVLLLALIVVCMGTACDMLSKKSVKVQQTQTIAIEESLESTLIEDDVRTYYLYITVDGVNFKRYPYEEDTVTPQALIAAIAEKTGWHLPLADAVTDSKGGMSVVFAKDCSIFSEVPPQQNEEFAVETQADMVAAVLGSVQKTLQCYAEPLAPDKVDIYFAIENDTPLEIEGILSLPLEQPYTFGFWHEK